MSTPARLIPIPSPTVAPSAARDFDFLMGPWRIRNTRLVRRLAGCNEWEVFDPVTQRWSIYWLDNLTGGLDPANGLLLPPVVGGFQSGVGLFEGEELFEGRPV